MPEIVKKKIAKKKAVKKKVSSNSNYSIPKKVVKKKIAMPLQNKTKNTEQLLIENFASLQRVMVNLSSRFDELSNQISQLLNLFEVSAQALAKRNFDLNNNNSELISKLDSLAQQNKIIARGVSLLHEHEESAPNMTRQAQPMMPPSPPQQRMPSQRAIPSQPRGPPQVNPDEGLRKSISQREEGIPPHREIRRAITEGQE